jgi:CRISPR/Cas system-associated exonuclease Cas4 (RecB family)
MDEWRDSLRRGITYLHKETNLLVTRGVDDVWVTPAGELLIVDYKATSKEDEVNLDAEWQDGYKRQMEIYQWLFRKNGFKVSDTGYFVYANGKADEPAFNEVVKFRVNTFPYKGDASWVEKTLQDIKDCLEGDIPEVGSGPLGQGCEFCAYARSRTELTLKALQQKSVASKK